MIFTFDVSPLANGHDRGQVATVRDYVISIEYSSELLRKVSKYFVVLGHWCANPRFPT